MQVHMLTYIYTLEGREGQLEQILATKEPGS